jgi:hypothetical protein
MSGGLKGSYEKLEYEYLPPDSTAIDVSMQEINLLIAALTFLGSASVVVIMAWWLIRLRDTETHFRPFVLAVAIAKSAVAFWSGTGIVQILAFDMTQPILTLPARILMMIAVLIQIVVAMRYYRRAAS